MKPRFCKFVADAPMPSLGPKPGFPLCADPPGIPSLSMVAATGGPEWTRPSQVEGTCCKFLQLLPFLALHPALKIAA
jgi:hypothetical protein